MNLQSLKDKLADAPAWLRGLGVDTGIDLAALITTSQWLSDQLGKELPGMLARAGDFPNKA